jgi:hypothetical protein
MADNGRKARFESPAAASLSEQAAKGANDILSASVDALQGRMCGQHDNEPLNDTIMNPNGQQVRLTQFIDHDYFAEDHTSIFAKDPGEYMKEPSADCMYVWPAKSDPQLFARVRAGSYRPVGTDELRDDCALPVTTHTVPGIANEDGSPKRLVAVYDLCLMEVQPKAVKKLYKWPAFEAALRTKQNLPFEKLRQDIERLSRGTATAVMDSKVEK